MKLKAELKKFEKKNKEAYKYRLDFVFGKNYC
jgi:hypothetical protein